MALTTRPATLDADRAAVSPGPVPAERQPAVVDDETRRSAPKRDRPQRRELSPLEPSRVLGQALVWLGGLLVALALFQLWGTGLLEWRAQVALDAEFEAAVTDASEARDPAQAGLGSLAVPGSGPGATDAATTATLSNAAATAEATPRGEEAAIDTAPTAGGALAGAGPPPGEGTAIGRITIPAIGVSKTIVQGVERPTLRNGPGHYPTTPLPGQAGNAAIAGHRTTHGAPFLELDSLDPGDVIEVETLGGNHRYEVMAHTAPDGSERGHFIVDPSDVSVIGDHGDNRLTLTACHPRYTARQRIIVTAQLIGEPFDPELAAGGADTASAADALDPAAIEGGQTIGVDEELLEDSLGWRTEETEPTVLWATITAIVLHAGWIVSRLWRRRAAYLLTAPVAAVPLFICFIHLDRLLPAF